MVVTIQAVPQMKDVDVGVFTLAGATTGEDGLRQQVRFIGKKKVAFDIATEKDTFFETKHVIERNPSKLPIIAIMFDFNPFLEAGPSR